MIPDEISYSLYQGSRRGLNPRYSGYGSIIGKDQRPSSLRSKSSREREDIRFFFKSDEPSTSPDASTQPRSMANSTSEKRRTSSDQHQSEYDRYVSVISFFWFLLYFEQAVIPSFFS